MTLKRLYVILALFFFAVAVGTVLLVHFKQYPFDAEDDEEEEVASRGIPYERRFCNIHGGSGTSAYCPIITQDRCTCSSLEETCSASPCGLIFDRRRQGETCCQEGCTKDGCEGCTVTSQACQLIGRTCSAQDPFCCVKKPGCPNHCPVSLHTKCDIEWVVCWRYTLYFNTILNGTLREFNTTSFCNGDFNNGLTDAERGQACADFIESQFFTEEDGETQFGGNHSCWYDPTQQDFVFFEPEDPLPYSKKSVAIHILWIYILGGAICLCLFFFTCASYKWGMELKKKAQEKRKASKKKAQKKRKASKKKQSPPPLPPRESDDEVEMEPPQLDPENSGQQRRMRGVCVFPREMKEYTGHLSEIPTARTSPRNRAVNYIQVRGGRGFWEQPQYPMPTPPAHAGMYTHAAQIYQQRNDEQESSEGYYGNQSQYVV